MVWKVAMELRDAIVRVRYIAGLGARLTVCHSQKHNLSSPIGKTYGGAIFWPWKTSLESSRPTLP